jgi:glucose/arabinose dehydrogenase
LRNPNGLSFAPGLTPVLWTAVNERDELGSDLVPDYMTSVRDGGFYGCPSAIMASMWTSAPSHSSPNWSRGRSRRTMR